MAVRYRKKTLPPGEYWIGGKPVQLTESRLRSAIHNTQRLLKKGVRIPVPFAHVDESGVVPGPFIESREGAPIDHETGKPIGWRSDLNAGFLTSIRYDNGVEMEIEVDGEENDPNTPAGKIGKTIRDTSLVFRPDYRTCDGEQLGEVIYQAAVVTNPVEHGQENFALAMNETILMATSTPPAKPKPKSNGVSDATNPFAKVPGADAQKGPMGGQEPDGDEQMSEESSFELSDNPEPEQPEQDVELIDAIQALNEFGISIPSETTRDEFISRLRLCLRQYLADRGKNGNEGEKNDNDPSHRPPGETPSAPIAMSQNTSVDDSADKLVTIMMSQHALNTKAKLRSRVQRLVASGKISGKWAQDNLEPKIKQLAFSSATLTPEAIKTLQETGEFPLSEVEHMIAGFESTMGPDLTKDISAGEVSLSAPAGSIPDSSPSDAYNVWLSDETGSSNNGEDAADVSYKLALSY